MNNLTMFQGDESIETTNAGNETSVSVLYRLAWPSAIITGCQSLAAIYQGHDQRQSSP